MPNGRSRRRLLAAVLLATAWPAAATTVVPPSFEHLVDAAARVVVAEVVRVEPRAAFAPGGRRVIVTAVTFAPRRVVKGEETGPFVVEFLGGTLGDETMEVVGSPRWVVGDRDVLFLGAGRSRLSPLVGLMHGRVRVRLDAAGVETVATYAGDPIAGVDDLWRTERAGGRGAARPMTLSAFVAAVDARVRAVAAR